MEDIYFRDLEDLSSAVLAGYCLSQVTPFFSPPKYYFGTFLAIQVMQHLSNNTGAPEILKARGYDNKVDSWNVGILIYKLFVRFFLRLPVFKFISRQTE